MTTIHGHEVDKYVGDRGLLDCFAYLAHCLEQIDNELSRMASDGNVHAREFELSISAVYSEGEHYLVHMEDDWAEVNIIKKPKPEADPNGEPLEGGRHLH